MITSSDNPLSVQSETVVQQLRQVLVNNGYATQEAANAINQLCGGRQLSEVTRIPDNEMPSLAGTGIPENLESLLRLFIFGATLQREQVARAIAPMDIDDWFKMGLLVEVEDGVCAQLQLMVYRNIAIALDFNSMDKAKNHVIGITAATQTLEFLTIRRKVHSILDVGTGTGVQAMLASAHGEKIIATDINERAVNVASFNAWLNGMDVSFRAGDLFDPVKNESFDLIISCPPFVLSPDDRFTYLDSGHRGDHFLEKLVTEGAQLLNENGYMQVMCQIAQYGDQPWSDRIAGWLNDTGCDAWVLYQNTASPEEHARMWVPGNSSSHDELLQEWLEYYTKNNITSITSCLLTIRKNSATENWFCVDQIPQGNGYCGDSIESGFRARDALNSIKNDNALLQTSLIFTSDVDISSSTGAGTNGDKLSTIQINKGLMFSETVDEMTMDFLQNCDGNLVAEIAIEQAQQSSGQTVDIKEFIENVRNLISKGFLLPA